MKPARQQDGTYLVPQRAEASSLRIYRNGVRQSAGDDYTYDSNTRIVSPVAGHPWNDDDLVLCDYRY